MLISFSVQNFGAFKEMQTLSFEAANSQHLEEYYIIQPQKGLRLLKLMLLYGANASGKSTLLKAIDFLRNVVINPLPQKSDKIAYYPFLFDTETPQQDSLFIVECIPQKIKYRYELRLNQQAIIEEKLYVYNPKKAVLFHRTTNTVQQLAQISFGEKAKITKQTQQILEANVLWNNTVIAAYSKTNVTLPDLQILFNWFKNTLKDMIQPHTNLMPYISEQINNQHIDKKQIIDLLQTADFKINDIIIRSNIHSTNPQKETFFQHNISPKVKVELSYQQESDGTKRYYQMAGLASLMLQQPAIFMLDEIESSLHPDLLKHFIQTILSNVSHSQILMTTHYRELLQEKDILRNDAIWFTNQKTDGSSELYPLSDFDSNTIRDTSSIYNAYKIGKLGAVPILGDYYLPLPKQKEVENGKK